MQEVGAVQVWATAAFAVNPVAERAVPLEGTLARGEVCLSAAGLLLRLGGLLRRKWP